jgi:hypothetical protein
MVEKSTGAARPWLEVDIGASGVGLQATVRGSRGERPEPQTLGPGVTFERLQAFAESLRAMALQQSPLEGQLEQAQAFHSALFQGAVQKVLLPLREAAKDGPVLLQLGLNERLLQAFPWEALCEPKTQWGFLGNSTEVLVARGVASTQPWLPREVQGAVRVQALVPQAAHTPALQSLQRALQESIASGEVEWLEPLTGARLQPRFLPELLRREPMPHILHFVGHGSVKSDGTPMLQFVDADGEERWLEVESLVEQIKASGLHKHLRLIVLDACEGAQPGAFASAAELLARTGVAAVVAHLWPVRNDVARLCSSTFYRALTGVRSPHKGDVALSLHEARRMVLMEHGTAEAFSPVLYLRGHDSVLFDFTHRKELKERAHVFVRDSVFISHSEKDLKWLQRLEEHLMPLIRSQGIKTWNVTKTPAGAEWKKELEAALAQTKVAVLLVSASFLASDSIFQEQLLPLLRAAEHEGLKILWVPVSASMVEKTELSKYQPVLKKPLNMTNHAHVEKALVTVCEEIEKALKSK